MKGGAWSTVGRKGRKGSKMEGSETKDSSGSTGVFVVPANSREARKAKGSGRVSREGGNGSTTEGSTRPAPRQLRQLCGAEQEQR